MRSKEDKQPACSQSREEWGEFATGTSLCLRSSQHHQSWSHLLPRQTPSVHSLLSLLPLLPLLSTAKPSLNLDSWKELQQTGRETKMREDLGRLAALCARLPSGTGATANREVPKLVKHGALIQSNPVAGGRAGCHSYQLYASRRCSPLPGCKSTCHQKVPIVVLRHKLQVHAHTEGKRKLD